MICICTNSSLQRQTCRHLHHIHMHTHTHTHTHMHTHTHTHAHTHTQIPYTCDNATFCNKPWLNFFQHTGIQPAELWLPNTVKLSSANSNHPVHDLHSAPPSSASQLPDAAQRPPLRGLVHGQGQWGGWGSLGDALAAGEYPSVRGPAAVAFRLACIAGRYLEMRRLWGRVYQNEVRTHDVG